MASRGSRHPVSKDVQYSKTMSYLLRHGAEKEGLKMTKDGFVKIDDLLQHKNMRNATREEVIKIVENCPKKRFHIENIKNEDGTLEMCVRANQGHTLEDVEVNMKEIGLNDQIDQCIHGTYYEAWEIIKKEGLSKMKRQHIHFSEDFPGSKQVISGMRSNCQIAIFIDIKKCLSDGLKFFKSENNVILCSGDQSGHLKPKYFSRVVDLKKNIDIEDYVKTD